MEKIQLKLSDVKFDGTIYPRKTHNPAKVQEYAANLEAIEAQGNFIHVSANNKLLDGRHRHLAYLKKADGKLDGVSVTAYQWPEILETKDELLKAIELNSSHGQQLTTEEKRQNCLNLYAKYGYTLDTIAKAVAVSKAFALESTKAHRENDEKNLNAKIMEMWLACYSHEEIANDIGNVSDETVRRKTEHFATKSSLEPNVVKSSSFEDFTPELYNVWTFAKKTNEVGHFGNSEQRIVENLLYAYTKPFDIVVDPFGGGGSTIDVCIKRSRRYWVSDRKPIVERESEIRKLDVLQELPPLHNRWSDVTLTYLDPPYWKQAENQYSTDPEDLANMPLEDFTRNMCALINGIAKKQSKGFIALLIQPTQWKAEKKRFTDHVFQIMSGIKAKNLTLENRISCPYSSQQYNAQMVDYAKEHKIFLVLTRELIVWRVDEQL